MSFVFAACGNGAPTEPGTGGVGGTSTVGGGSGTGGAAGTHANAGTGGSTGATGGAGGTAGSGTGATGGAAGSGTGAVGGTAGTGGGTGATGGTTAGTGSQAGGAGGDLGKAGSSTGGRSAGGRTGAGGMPGTGGGAGSGQAGGSAAGSGGSGGGGSCVKGATDPATVVIMGESFYAISPQYIQNRIQDNARTAGSLASGKSYRNVAVSGQNMNYIATNEWTAATQGGATVKWVIMDGGGIDCLGSSGGAACSSCAGTFQTLLGKMATAGVTDVIYTRYPEPGNPPGSNMDLKKCLDATMPNMQTTCEGSTSPRCHWVDLRPVWVNGDTTDGLHPTQSGGEHVGDLIWSEMVKLCFAQ